PLVTQTHFSGSSLLSPSRACTASYQEARASVTHVLNHRRYPSLEPAPAASSWHDKAGLIDSSAVLDKGDFITRQAKGW
ncbi:MAG TPA: hypothetical protein VF773_05115, partial [Verrucomicrobiae bacterium]